MTVFVGPSIWRQMQVRTATSMFAAMASNPTTERVIWAPLWNDALIGRSRSIMCTEFLATDADVMVIIDDDIVFDPGDFWKIVEGCRETEAIYGAAYVTRSTEPHISSRWMPGTGEQVFAQTPNRRPVEYQYLATGFLAVHRKVLEAMMDGVFTDAWGTHRVPLVELGADRPFYPFFSPFVCREADGRLHYLSEDWAFSNRARQLGFRVWVDLSIILIHMGWYPYTVADLDGMKQSKLPSTGIDSMAMTGAPQTTGEPLLDELIADIAAWSGDTLGDVRRSLEVGPDTLNGLWLRRNGTREEDWYKQEDVGTAYVADLAAWHLRGGGVPLLWAEDLNGRSLLDFGAGIGTWALAAARAGSRVTVVETNPLLREFIGWRAEKYGLSVTVLEELPDLGRFGAISAWHVFEHLARPELYLERLLGLLAPNGRMITDSGFGDASTLSHHADPGWDEILAKAGLLREQAGVYRRTAEVPA